MNTREKVIQYIQNHPDMEHLRFTDALDNKVARTPRLNDYLAVLGNCYMMRYTPDGNLKFTASLGKNLSMVFNLKTGEPDTEADWKTFAELVGIKL